MSLQHPNCLIKRSLKLKRRCGFRTRSLHRPLVFVPVLVVVVVAAVVLILVFVVVLIVVLVLVLVAVVVLVEQVPLVGRLSRNVLKNISECAAAKQTFRSILLRLVACSTPALFSTSVSVQLLTMLLTV